MYLKSENLIKASTFNENERLHISYAGRIIMTMMYTYCANSFTTANEVTQPKDTL